MGHHLFRGGFSIDQRCALHWNSASTACHRLHAGAGRLQKRWSWQPTFVHLDRGSRTVPIAVANIQVKIPVDLGSHNTNPVILVDHLSLSL
jgi:hypothetical protein